MAGELWNEVVQIGKETTAGTSVAATRKLYTRNPKLVPNRQTREHRFAVGTRETVRQATSGVEGPGGDFQMVMSSDEIVELLLAGVKGAVTPTTPATAVNTRLWTFVPGTTLDPITVEWQDGQREWEIAGTHVDKLTIAGAAGGESLVTAELFGRNMVQSTITGALVDRVPNFIEGWQTKLYVDNYAATPGTTVIAATLLNWNVMYENGLGRKYFADNSKAVGGVTLGEVKCTAKLTLEASVAQSLTEFNNMVNATKRLVRLEFQDETAFIETTFRRFVTVDLPGYWSAIDLGQSDAGTRVYQLTFGAVYDTTNAFMAQIRAQNNRATAY